MHSYDANEGLGNVQTNHEKRVLVLVEHDHLKIHPATGNLVSAALKLGFSPILLVVGHQCRAVAEQAAALKGVQSVWCADSPCYEHLMAESLADLMMNMIASVDCVIGPSSTFGKNILPRFAAKWGGIQVSDVLTIFDENTFERPIYAGNAIETVRVLAPKKVLTIRLTAFLPVVEQQQSCPIEMLDLACTFEKTRFVSHVLTQSKRPELGSARIVVSGGRGLQSAEKFKLMEELADVLGAAIGASRAAVDAGFVSNEYQVGQTGRVVAPDLYIAVGISGAIQHLAGMKDSKVVVAINKDPDAPIFQIADYGLVGDLFELVPELITFLQEK